MKDEVKEMVAKIGSIRELVDILDVTLTGPDDRAYIVCLADDCRNNSKERCSIHTVQSRQGIQAGGHCRDYEV